MKIIPYFLYIFLITFYNTILSDIISIYGVTVDLLVLIVVVVSLFKSETEALWFSMAAGIVVGSTRLDLMPWEILTICVTAIAVKQASSRINLESLASKVVVLASAVLFHGMVLTLVTSANSFFTILLRVIIPGTIYTVIVSMLFFLFKDGRISWEDIKGLF